MSCSTSYTIRTYTFLFTVNGRSTYCISEKRIEAKDVDCCISNVFVVLFSPRGLICWVLQLVTRFDEETSFAMIYHWSPCGVSLQHVILSPFVCDCSYFVCCFCRVCPPGWLLSNINPAYPIVICLRHSRSLIKHVFHLNSMWEPYYMSIKSPCPTKKAHLSLQTSDLPTSSYTLAISTRKTVVWRI